jgi:hypothetical protein
MNEVLNNWIKKRGHLQRLGAWYVYSMLRVILETYLLFLSCYFIMFQHFSSEIVVNCGNANFNLTFSAVYRTINN